MRRALRVRMNHHAAQAASTTVPAARGPGSVSSGEVLLGFRRTGPPEYVASVLAGAGAVAARVHELGSARFLYWLGPAAGLSAVLGCLVPVDWARGLLLVGFVGLMLAQLAAIAWSAFVGTRSMENPADAVATLATIPWADQVRVTCSFRGTGTRVTDRIDFERFRIEGFDRSGVRIGIVVAQRRTSHKHGPRKTYGKSDYVRVEVMAPDGRRVARASDAGFRGAPRVVPSLLGALRRELGLTSHAR